MLSAASAERYPPPQYKTIFALASGITLMMSRSIIPLPKWIASTAWPAFHSLSSRTSTNRNFSPAARRIFTSATLVSFTRLFASVTILKNGSECCIESPSVNLGPPEYHTQYLRRPRDVAVENHPGNYDACPYRGLKFLA